MMYSLAPQPGVTMMWNKLAIAATLAASVAGGAFAQQSTTTGAATPVQAQVLSSVPANSTTVTNFYKQNVYDPSDTKIGEISDVLVSKEGKVEAFIVSVGGFLGIGDSYHPLPWQSLTYDERQGGYVVDIDHSRLEGAPSYKSSDPDRWTDPTYGREVNDYYGITGPY